MPTTNSLITTWVRLEPRARSEDLSLSLQARIHDPLWLLTRQWQLGEFQGEDAGSPYKISIQYENTMLNKPIWPNTNSDNDNPKELPLETLVEREKIDTDSENFAIESGTYFGNLLTTVLGSHYVADLLQKLSTNNSPLIIKQELSVLDKDLNVQASRLSQLMRNRVFNGSVLFKMSHSKSADESLAELGIVSEHTESVKQVIERWKKRYPKNLTSDSAWLTDRLEYSFTTSTDTSNGQINLKADEYTGGDLDWYHFDASLTQGTTSVNTSQTLELIPTPVGFTGMPAERFWEFEEGSIDFGDIDANTNDLALLFLSEFMLIYGNDFFLAPLRLPVGSVTKITNFTVSDTFQQSLPIAPINKNNHNGVLTRFFCLGNPGDNTCSDLFFLPPVLPQIATMESKPIEEVAFMRDEGANLAWAIVKHITNAVGQRVDLKQVYTQATLPQPSLAANTDSDALQWLYYHFRSQVPPYWVPLQKIDHVFRLIQNNKASMNDLGEILNELQKQESPTIQGEEIPTEGVRLLRKHQLTRWSDGKYYLWSNRTKQIGQREKSSGLRFDYVESTPNTSG
jgi:hypothetical protein